MRWLRDSQQLASPPMPGPPGDHYFQSDAATIIVRESSPDHSWWLVTWLPNDQEHPSYPGFTVSSNDVPFPTDNGPVAAAEWMDRWAKERSAGRTPDDVLDVPAAAAVQDAPAADVREDAESRRAHAGWETEISGIADGRWEWRTYKEGATIHTGIADTYDDAKLDSIMNFPPPSLEP